MIIPYGHEHTIVRRLPWVTFTIIGLCVLVFIPTYVLSTGGDDEAVAERANEAFRFLQEHPYLELPSDLVDFLVDNTSEDEYRMFQVQLDQARRLGRKAPASAMTLKDEQREFERLSSELLLAVHEARRGPFFTWGLVPKDMKAHTLITHQFLHGGFLHLFFNVLFLYLVGPFIEDVWGRPLFATFYLGAGLMAALLFALHYPALQVPLIGASGAIAGVMGAFLIRYWNTRIRFFYWFLWLLLPIVGTFTAPAWLMLPLWFSFELLKARLWDVIAPGAGGGGTAHWAHVWGFVFGLGVAGMMKYYRLEERFIDKSIESKITVHDALGVEEALAAAAQGRPEDGMKQLRSELERDPDNVDAAIAYWNVASAHGKAEQANAYMLRVVRQAARSGDDDMVVAHWRDLLDATPQLQVESGLAVRVAEILERSGGQGDLQETIAIARRGLAPDTPAGVLVRLARLAAAAWLPDAPSLIERALAHPDIPPESRSELEALAASRPGARVAEAEGHRPDPVELAHDGEAAEVLSVSTVDHTLEVMAARPIGLDGGTLSVEARGESRTLALDQIQAIGVAGVNREGGRPFLIVDLMLDPPWSDRPKLRVLRLKSTDFDPRRLVGGSDSMGSLRALLGTLLEASDAVPLPDSAAARGRPFKTFPSLQAYEREVLGVE